MVRVKRWTQKDHLTPKIACAVAVYNKPRELLMCLEGYRRQSFVQKSPQDFQLILADDGSGPEIEEIFTKFSREVPFQTTFIRQEHQGWGKIRMLNWAALECRAESIIFTDGDCVAHKHFVQSHFESSHQRKVACGRRVDVLERATEKLTLEDVRSGTMESPLWLLKNMIQYEIDFGEQGFFLPNWVAKRVPFFSKNPKPTLVGSNFSIRKKWLLDLNGFDETYSKPGYGEDTDLERRLGMIGLDLEWITYRAIQFHLWHPLTQVGEDVRQIFESLRERGSKTALKGIREFLPEYEKLPK